MCGISHGTLEGVAGRYQTAASTRPAGPVSRVKASCRSWTSQICRTCLPSCSKSILTASLAQTLRHLFHHGTHSYPSLHKRLDVDEGLRSWLENQAETSRHVEPVFVRSQPISIQRLRERSPGQVEALLETARKNTEVVTLSPSAWTVDELAGPNVTDKDTVLSFAEMSASAYDYPPSTGNWKDVKGSFNYSNSFGWERDGIRGHIYADEGNSTVIIVFKGTSGAVYDSGGSETNDKVNDNLFFSCCCGQGGHYMWRQVCDCSSATYSCNQTCLVKTLREENHYYRAALDLYSNVTHLYPDSTVWAAGHSLGGSVGSLLGLTYGLPTVTFEAPPEALAAARLGLPTPPGFKPGLAQTRTLTGATHFGHTADPVYMGLCNGATSVCTLSGYAMEAQCHTGRECIYDTVQDKGWRVWIGTHSIRAVIRDVLEVYDTVPKCVANTECVDCFNWKYFESNRSDSTTSSTTTASSTSRRRTSTCRTPGWWGCLDETTTTTNSHGSSSTTGSSPVVTTTITTTTCKTPGWFGCNDPTTTTTTSTSTKAETGPTLTITPTPSLTSIRSITSSSSPSSLTSASTTCTSRGWFGYCRDKEEATSTTKTNSPSSIPQPASSLLASSSSSRSCLVEEGCSRRDGTGHEL